MSMLYDRYILKHKDGVIKAYQWFNNNLPELIPFDLNAEYAICIEHDNSKISKEEYDAYDAYFYGGNRSTAVVEDFNKAWLHHIHANPHHWQHWVLINDDAKDGMVLLDMPYRYILEMICDWWSFSWTTGNLHSIFDWYMEHKDYIKMSPKTKTTVDDILDKLKERLGYISEKNEGVK